MSKVVLSAIASAFTVIVSPLPLAVIVVLVVPVVTPIALSVALPAETVRLPDVPLASTEPTRLLTVKSLVLALPVRVRLALSASVVASMVRS